MPLSQEQRGTWDPRTEYYAAQEEGKSLSSSEQGLESYSRQHSLRPDAWGLLLPKQNNSNQEKKRTLYNLIFIFTGFGRSHKVWNSRPFGELCIY